MWRRFWRNAGKRSIARSRRGRPRTSAAPGRRASPFPHIMDDGWRQALAGGDIYPERTVAILADLCGLSAKELTDR
jgi:hypothetical protein